MSYVDSELAKDETRELPDEGLLSREGVHQHVEYANLVREHGK